MILRMMLGGKPEKKTKPVLRKKNEDGLAINAPLWRMLFPDFEGKIEIVKCGPGEEGWYDTIVGNFRVPDKAALNALLPQGKGGSSHAGGAAAGTKPLDDKKRKGDSPAAGGEKVPKLRKTRMIVISKHKPADSVETVKEPISASILRSSPSKASDAEAQKKTAEDPVIEVVSSEGTPPAVRAERLSKNTEGDSIADTLDTSDNLIDPRGEGDKGAKSQSPLFMQMFPALLLRARRVKISLQFSRMRLSWIIVTALTQQGVDLIARAAAAVKDLADANADRSKLNKAVEEFQAELKTRESILEEVTSRATEAEARARQAEEDRDGLATSLAQVTSDRAWMRQHGIGHVVEAILDAPENAVAVDNVNERARQAGFKAGYNKCLNNVNPFFASKFTDERSGFHGVDTEAAFDAAVDVYNSLTIPAIERIEACLEVDDYLDRLRILFELVKEGEGTSGANAE
ncbi:hypothetical protein HanXRQr2_Chr15g0686671 [Helianthus annuus]|uniref:Uncharacterized protein n=2 Tax=Helianthus annuus TaxID=4232 RepID=A0A9K3DYS8_HELAN|nr:hypothetical protein HanXRQr2_Chr15g0686671 [Helianthus annuus]KAJ0450730.1 hypothetical protein HanHA300_Chr15g0559531 [Helianthus annuus]KAJ0454983.1 hypothetical protein HanIR_Chr15g0746101 [Helianthus annuus]KAJ0472582.1 hypothetical protein HanHA89_Chr15g0608661 [Helianthus annuus]KAJ0648186.1 hypothetical protein HanLR1_Chr15g0570051 [Helianthus annuus]